MYSAKQQRGVEKRGASIAGGVTLLMTLFFVTPLCGLLFQCGCDWLWAGLHTACNFYQAEAEHRCPWCESMFTGIMATAIAIVAGVWTAVKIARSRVRLDKEIVIRILSGLGVFIAVAVLSALIAAWRQDYPFGIGYFIQRGGSDLGVLFRPIVGR